MRRTAKILGLGIGFVLLIVLILSAWAWTNRYSLLEDRVKDTLKAQGIAAQLSIQSITRERAVIKDIVFSDHKNPSQSTFFKADTITADYVWRDALKGVVTRIEMHKADIQVSIDAQGRIIEGWQPPSNQEGGEFQAPQDGIIITDGYIDLTTPYGLLKTGFDATYYAPERFSAALTIKPSDIIATNTTVENLSGNIAITRNGLTVDFMPALKVKGLKHGQHSLADVAISGPITITPDEDYGITADITAQFSRADIAGLASLTMGAGRLAWQGTAVMPRESPQNLSLNGTWSLDLADVMITDDDTRRGWARKLTLAETLSRTPVAEGFIDNIVEDIDQLLSKSDMSAAGQITYAPDSAVITLSKPASIKGDNTLTLSPRADHPLYAYAASDAVMTVRTDAALTGSRAIDLSDMSLVMRTDTGRNMKGVEAFTAKLRSQATWKTQRRDGPDYRLAPLSVAVDYKNLDGTSKTVLTGAIDYDGLLPGGVVTDFKAVGRLVVRAEPGNTRLAFTPSKGRAITLSSLETRAGWQGRNLSFRVLPQIGSSPPLLERTAQETRLSTVLSDFTGKFIQAETRRQFQADITQLDVKSVLKSNKQDWTLTASDTTIQSNDIPSFGTVITAEKTDMSVILTVDELLQFTVDSPHVNAKTELITARNMAVNAKGTPQNFTLDYAKGRAKFPVDRLPALPLTGQVIYDAGRWVGDAETFLPNMLETPIAVNYSFADSIAEADVQFNDLRFVPGGFQPQSLIPALAGKIADVDGGVDAQLNFKFVPGEPLQSSGIAVIQDMALGTLSGPLTGMNTTLEFSSIVPLKTTGMQTLTMDSFDPGLPLRDGVINFALIPDGITVESARWPLGDGFFSLDPFNWRYSAPRNKVVMRIENVSVGEFIENFGNGALEATGNIVGELPVVLEGISVNVENGYLAVKNGGVIRYNGPRAPDIGTPENRDLAQEAVSVFRRRDQDSATKNAQYSDLAFDALREFRYEELSAKINGPLDGALGIGMVFHGQNAQVLGGQPFKFNIDIEGELLNIARSFDSNAQIENEILRRKADIDP